MSHFHILYALDDNYAPFCGVSVTSLFENNKMIPDITVHVIGHDISQDNCRKLFSIGEKFGREIILYNADDIVGKIKDFNMPLYRGSYATNIRLFFADIIDMDSDRLLYLDSDTLVVGSLEELVSYDFKGNICAAVQESLGQHYKKLIGFAPGDVYFNAGVLLIHIPSWKNEKCSMRILNYLSQTQSRPANNDQDIINILLKEKIATLSLRYNFQPTHRVYPFKDYVDVYHPVGYYSDREVKEASLHPRLCCILIVLSVSFRGTRTHFILTLSCLMNICLGHLGRVITKPTQSDLGFCRLREFYIKFSLSAGF